MSHVSNFTNTDDEILTALILYDNPGLFLTAATTDYLNPAVNIGVLNTTITVAPMASTGYTGVVDVFYDRLDVQDFVDIANPDGITIYRAGAALLSDILSDINLALGINLTLSDIADQVLPTPTGEPGEKLSVSAPILKASKIYIGELRFSLESGSIDLNSIIRVKELSGLHYPVPR